MFGLVILKILVLFQCQYLNQSQNHRSEKWKRSRIFKFWVLRLTFPGKSVFTIWPNQWKLNLEFYCHYSEKQRLTLVLLNCSSFQSCNRKLINKTPIHRIESKASDRLHDSSEKPKELWGTPRNSEEPRTFGNASFQTRDLQTEFIVVSWWRDGSILLMLLHTASSVCLMISIQTGFSSSSMLNQSFSVQGRTSRRGGIEFI